jgi:NADPH2:quinone reductase
VTAHYLVKEIRPVERGTRVLVHAGAGGTGRTVVQWLRHLGAEVFATVGTIDKGRVATEAGADHVILYDEVDLVDAVRALTGGAGVDYVVDGVGGPSFRRNLRVLAERGTVCVFGRAGGAPETFSSMELLAKGITVTGAMSSQFLRTREEYLRKGDEVWRGIRDGWLTPLVHRVVPLDDAAEAHRLLEGRHTVGKLVLRVA